MVAQPIEHMTNLNPSDYNLAAETMLRYASALKIENSRHLSDEPIFIINARKIRNLQQCAAKMFAACDKREDAIDDYLDFVQRECCL